MALASVYPNRHLDRLSRFVYRPWSMQRNIGVRRSEKKQSKPHSLIPFACATTKCIDAAKATKGVTDNNPRADDIWFPLIYTNSSHRDGAIYKNLHLQEEWSDADITDRSETRLEPMMFSKATRSCLPDPENCMFHFPQHMLQFISLTLAESHISSGSIQLYGYIAVRDEMDSMLNYVLNHSRDDPIIVQQGSLIEMTGPKRGIEMEFPVLIEFDMRIKNGEQEKDDLQLIDGAIACRHRRPWKPIINRITGNCGAVDISLAYVEHAVEATIEVVISEVQRGFSLSLTSLVYIKEDFEEVQLFHGSIGQSRGLRRFVVAVTLGTRMFLRFRVGSNNVERYRSFKAKLHGCVTRQIKLEQASFSVKVTWSTI
ncbi:uncharacterized protein LOC133883670 [Phragmites australis]|uniref:uncharacterized protein LOC133883670 n=1 Tax=Phragmites australis TaxID=29695 RepID=UPI002D779408|nr:uncharacterized protein LOC133883670 [Phragmites australis]